MPENFGFYAYEIPITLACNSDFISKKGKTDRRTAILE